MNMRSLLVQPVQLSTIRGTLVIGFGALVLCLLTAGAVGWIAVQVGARDVSSELQSVLMTSRVTAGYANIISREIDAATGYLVERNPATRADFHRLGQQAHRLQRRFNALPDRTLGEITGIAVVDNRLADFENAYALAHRLSDLGRTAAAQAQSQQGHQIVMTLLDNLGTFDQAKTVEVETATSHLNTQAKLHAAVVLGSMMIAMLLALLIAMRTVWAINRPLHVLTQHASRLSEGNFGVRTEPDGFPGEFMTLARAMNRTSESLSHAVDVAAHTADDVTHLADELTTTSKEISETAGQVSEAVTQVSMDAEVQVQHIQEVTHSLNSIRDGADGVAAGAEEVLALAESIETQAKAKQGELERSLGILYNVRTIVLQAVDEVRALNAAVGDINKFVVTVGRIADQTNLLSLNAAIEAARAGDAGRGFGVVADEIRKLADQARAAADDVVELTTSVTGRVASTSTTMERGATQVDEIERVSHEINQTLAAILAASAQTRSAADSVARTAEANVHAVEAATTNLASVERTAEGHAATAMEVSASSEEQSAACEQMSAASVQLLRGSTQLLELVRELKTA